MKWLVIVNLDWIRQKSRSQCRVLDTLSEPPPKQMQVLFGNHIRLQLFCLQICSTDGMQQTPGPSAATFKVMFTG